MNWRSTIGSSLMLMLYAGVLLHNAIPHIHIEAEEVDHAKMHHHHDAAHHHHGESSEKNSSEDASAFPDLTSLLAHANLGVNHFSDFTSGKNLFIPQVAIVLFLLYSIAWSLFLLFKISKPPEWRHHKALQLLYLGAASHRGPPSFS
ncbi:hypothetical protein WJR50_32760 [Catalinimonas sp. 4WD22]|uniref:hypothetical protein n=1 Tax=Catalinimonas locisalis TaxID=3133978 RepID=UPI003100F501